MNEKDPWQRGLLIILAAFAVAVPAAIVLAQSQVHGWPDGIGFPTRDGPAFWVGFWSSGFPTIAATAIITVTAGIYLSNRDHRREHMERAQHYEDTIIGVANRVASGLRIGMHGIDVIAVPRDSLVRTIVPATTTAYRELVEQPLSVWERYVPRYRRQYMLIQTFVRSYELCSARIASADNSLDMAIRRHYSNMIHMFAPPRWIMLMQQESHFRRYCIGRMQELDGPLITLHLSISDADLVAYRAMWDHLLTLDDVADVYDQYRDDWDHIDNEAMTVREALESMQPRLPDPVVPEAWQPGGGNG
jgi:predicted deacetylase